MFCKLFSLCKFFNLEDGVYVFELSKLVLIFLLFFFLVIFIFFFYSVVSLDLCIIVLFFLILDKIFSRFVFSSVFFIIIWRFRFRVDLVLWFVL